MLIRNFLIRDFNFPIYLSNIHISVGSATNLPNLLFTFIQVYVGYTEIYATSSSTLQLVRYYICRQNSRVMDLNSLHCKIMFRKYINIPHSNKYTLKTESF